MTISISPTAPSTLLRSLQELPSAHARADLDQAQAQRAAERLSQSLGKGAQGRRLRVSPELTAPGATALDAAQLSALLPQMAGQHPAMVPGATAEAFVTLHRMAAALAAAGGAAQRTDAAAMRAVMAQAQALVGLASAQDERAQPMAAQHSAPAGTAKVGPATLEFVNDVLADAPGLREVLDDAHTVPPEQLPLRMELDTRMAYVLLLVEILMQMNVGQRQQAVAMVQLAAQSVQAMGQSMVKSAKATQTAKIVVLAVGAAGAGGGVAMGGVAAAKGVASLRANKVGAQNNEIKADQHNVTLAENLNTAPAGSSATPAQLAALRQESQGLQEIASGQSTAHAIDTTKLGVMTNASHAVVQTSNGAGAVAGSPLDLESTGHSVDAEKDRVNKDIELDVGGRTQQEVSKTSEAERALFSAYGNRGQDNKQTADHMVGNMKH